MRALMLSDIRLVLSHLLDDKSDLLHSTHAGRLYGARLLAMRSALAALPEANTDRNPLSNALAEADTRHDAFGAAVWYYTEAVLRAPDTLAADRDAALRIRDTFVPQLSVLQVSYATEVDAARRNRARIPALAQDMARLTVPGESATLASWVEGFVSAGEALGELLAARAELRAGGSGRSPAFRLRAEVVGLLTRLRMTLADELDDQPDRLQQHEVELFGFVDELAKRREQSQRRRATTSEGDPSEVEPSAPPSMLHEAPRDISAAS